MSHLRLQDRDRHYDENSAELQWLEDSANDLANITAGSLVGVLFAACAVVWYGGVFLCALVGILLGAANKK